MQHREADPGARVRGLPRRRWKIISRADHRPGVGFAEPTARYGADLRLTVPATVYNAVLKRVDEV